MTESIYRSPAGKADVLDLYRQGLERLAVPVESRYVATRHGRTHVLVSGPEYAPPLVLFQGGNFLAPLTLTWFRPLAAAWRLYAPDTIGHPGRSDETRISPRDASYGEWALDVLDGLGLGAVPVIGLSYGAGIVLRLAGLAPARISRAVLLMPAGIVSPPVLPLLFRIVPWMLLYQWRPRRAWLDRAVAPLFTGPPEPEWVQAIGAIFRHLRLERAMPRNATREELGGFGAPVLLIAGERDPFFPGQRVAERAAEILPSLASARVIPASSHLLDRSGSEQVSRWIDTFLGDRP